jgi:hypothetical protein
LICSSVMFWTAYFILLSYYYFNINGAYPTRNEKGSAFCAPFLLSRGPRFTVLFL